MPPVDHLGFLLSQVAHIERQAYQVRYPDIQYQNLVPVDTSANQWARSITHFSTDRVGRAEPITGRASDIPLVDITRQKFDVPVHMAGIGYDYDIEELGQAMMVPNTNLTADKAMACRRAVEEYIDEKVLYGDPNYGWDGLINSGSLTGLTSADAASVGAGTDGPGSAADQARYWRNKTALQIIKDINDALQGVYVDSRTVAMADTIALPENVWSDLTSKVIDDTAITVTQFIKQNNVYTMKTGRELKIVEVRGLRNPGRATTGTAYARMIAYKRSPDVLRLHYPQPFRFLRPQQRLLAYIVPGHFRLGGLEIRLPRYMRYLDKIDGADASTLPVTS